MPVQKLTQLLQQYADNNISRQELAELAILLKEHDENALINSLETIAIETAPASEPNEKRLQVVLSKIRSSNSPAVPVHRVHFLRRGFLKYAAAILIIFGACAYLWNTSNQSSPLANSTKPVPVEKNILPGGKKAILLLGDESVINLDTTADGQIAQQGRTDIIKSAGGEIIYAGNSFNGSNSGEVYYQKLITPNGGQYSVTLSDGTQVWLNAASSVRFPNVFTGNERIVEITGEVYLDVKKDANRPFIVKANNETIEVLGTEFNIRAYFDEPATKTSLISGKIKINGTILNPSQSYAKGKLVPFDANCAAWKNGAFQFTSADLTTVLRELARWYDVQVVYEGNIPARRFSGSMGRNLTLMQVLKGLERMDVKFRIENNKLIVEHR